MIDVTELSIRCPGLGSEVTFGYCLRAGDDCSICTRTLSCWWERFDIVSLLERVLPEHHREKLQLLNQKSRLHRILETIQSTRQDE